MANRVEDSFWNLNLSERILEGFLDYCRRYHL